MGNPKWSIENGEVKFPTLNPVSEKKRRAIDFWVNFKLNQLYEEINREFKINNPYWNDDDALHKEVMQKMHALMLAWVEENHAERPEGE